MDDRGDWQAMEYYSARAPEYEQIYYRDVPQRRAEIEEETHRLEQLSNGLNVIELACGSGYWTEIIARRANTVTAVDFSKAMLVEAQAKTYRSTIEFIHADMFTLDLQKRFDLVALGFWFSHQPKEKMKSLFDLLKHFVSPTGQIWMVDNNPPAEGPINKSIRTDQYGNNYKTRYLDDGTEFVILKNYFSKLEIEEILFPYFEIQSLIYNECYWSTVLRPANPEYRLNRSTG